MSLSLPMLMTVLALSARGDIYSCRNASGQVSYQDHPCAGAKSAPLARGEDEAASLRALQRALAQRRPRASTPLVSGQPYVGRGGYSVEFVSEAQLASCSQQFFHCARGNAVAMDACVDRLPRCTASSHAGCCPQQCITRYQNLRQQGQGMAGAVRLALLDPDAPACASAAR